MHVSCMTHASMHVSCTEFPAGSLYITETGEETGNEVGVVFVDCTLHLSLGFHLVGSDCRGNR